jgi:hypothetical protein
MLTANSAKPPTEKPLIRCGAVSPPAAKPTPIIVRARFTRSARTKRCPYDEAESSRANSCRISGRLNLSSRAAGAPSMPRTMRGPCQAVGSTRRAHSAYTRHSGDAAGSLALDATLAEKRVRAISCATHGRASVARISAGATWRMSFIAAGFEWRPRTARRRLGLAASSLDPPSGRARQMLRAKSVARNPFEPVGIADVVRPPAEDGAISPPRERAGSSRSCNRRPVTLAWPRAIPAYSAFRPPDSQET